MGRSSGKHDISRLRCRPDSCELRLASGLSLGARFDGEFASRSQTYTGAGTARYVW